jgi:hypothetical protein
MDNVLFYKLHQAGLFNRLMSLEIGLGLAHCSNKKLVLYGLLSKNGLRMDNPSLHSKVDLGEREHIIRKEMPSLFSLLEDYKGHVDIEKIDYYDIETFNKDEIKINDKLQDYYFKVSEGENLLSFADGRKEILLPEGPVHMSGYNICNYGSFFFNRTKELDEEIKKIKFKDEYWDFAKVVAKSLGDFNGAHVRLTDHKENFEVTESDFKDRLDFLSDKPTFVLTDEVKNPMFLDKNIFILDDYIVQNFSKEFLSLSNNSEAVFGLVSAMIMTMSSKFVGTFLSTFTGFIQKEKLKTGNQNFIYFGKKTDPIGSPFSWNIEDRGYGIGMSRDWPESRLMV